MQKVLNEIDGCTWYHADTDVQHEFNSLKEKKNEWWGGGHVHVGGAS
jgi:hypothetical protein